MCVVSCNLSPVVLIILTEIMLYHHFLSVYSGKEKVDINLLEEQIFSVQSQLAKQWLLQHQPVMNPISFPNSNSYQQRFMQTATPFAPVGKLTSLSVC